MLRVFNDLYDRYFAEEEAIIFTLLLIGGTVIMLTMGSIIAPLLWALVITFILQGLVNFLHKLHCPHRWAVWLVYLLFVGVLLLVVLVFLPFIWGRLVLFINELPSMIDQWQSLLLLLPQEYPELFSEAQIQQVFASVQREMSEMGQSILSYSVSSLTRVATLVVYAVLVPILVFFMLSDSEKLLLWLESWLPEKRPIMAQIWHEMNDQLANYIRGKAIEIVLVGSVSYLAFLFFGLNYPVLLAVLIGLSVIIPYIGAMVVTIPVVFVGFLQWGFSADYYQLLIAYLVIQIIDGNILVPLIFSETVNLHPIAIIAAILVFGGLWGFWGVFFAIPLATFIKAIIRAWPDRYVASPESKA